MFKAKKNASARRRALTLPLPLNNNEIRETKGWRFLPSALRIAATGIDHEIKNVQKTLDQAQSPIFKLPFEIRQIIWKDVLQLGNTIHISHLAGRLGHVRCTYPAEDKWDRSRHDCWGRGCCLSGTRKSPSIYVGPIYGFEEPLNLLHLARTCRAIYSETINLLYTSNAFDFRYPHTVVSFCSTVPQHRLNLIKSLHLTCDIWDLNRVDVDPNLTSKVKIANSETEKMILEECFAAISRLEGLKVLRIEDLDRDRYSRNYHYAFSRDIQKMLVQSLRGIRQKEIFEVKTSWFAEENWRELGDLSLVEGDGSTTGHSLFHL